MKKAFFLLALSAVCSAAFANEKQPVKETIPQKDPKGNSVCETRSGTISSGGESITVSCTKCDNDPGVAAALATVCANGGVKKMTPYLQ